MTMKKQNYDMKKTEIRNVLRAIEMITETIVSALIGAGMLVGICALLLCL